MTLEDYSDELDYIEQAKRNRRYRVKEFGAPSSLNAMTADENERHRWIVVTCTSCGTDCEIRDDEDPAFAECLHCWSK